MFTQSQCETMNLSDAFKFDQNAKQPVAALAYSLDSIVAQLDLITGELEDSSHPDPEVTKKLISSCLFGVLETARMCSTIAHEIDEFMNLGSITMQDIRKKSDAIEAESQSICKSNMSSVSLRATATRHCQSQEEPEC